MLLVIAYLVSIQLLICLANSSKLICDERKEVSAWEANSSDAKTICFNRTAFRCCLPAPFAIIFRESTVDPRFVGYFEGGVATISKGEHLCADPCLMNGDDGMKHMHGANNNVVTTATRSIIPDRLIEKFEFNLELVLC